MMEIAFLILMILDWGIQKLLIWNSIMMEDHCQIKYKLLLKGYALCRRPSLLGREQPTEHFVIQWYISKPWKKNEIGWFFFHLAASRLKKMRFSKIANLVNAPAIHNQKTAWPISASLKADGEAWGEEWGFSVSLRFNFAPTSPIPFWFH